MARPDPTLHSHLRARRTAAGFSQSALAARVDVSRQAIIAIEAGRQVPSTALALQLAQALRCAVEDLFTLPGPPPLVAEPADPASPPAGRVALGRVAGRWIAHRLRDETAPGDGLVSGPAAQGRLVVQPLVDRTALESNLLVAGCAPLLGLLARRLGRRHRDCRATWLPVNSTRALDDLAEGRVHVAGLHLAGHAAEHEALVRDRLPGRAATMVNLTRWRQGLVLPPGNPLGLTAIDDLRRPGLRVARREAGSGSDVLLRRLLPGAALPRGPVAAGHADVARTIAWGLADVGLAIEAVALAAGLDFVPLAEERFDLVLAGGLDGPVERLLDLIDAPSFRAEARRLPGYDLSQAGHASTVAP